MEGGKCRRATGSEQPADAGRPIRHSHMMSVRRSALGVGRLSGRLRN
jgi:hypothetical protein